MNELIQQICKRHFGTPPNDSKRCAVGQGNYVYAVQYEDHTYIVRCSTEKGAYDMTVHWLSLLSEIELPVPKIVDSGHLDGFDYLILSYIEGVDLGEIYPSLTPAEKKQIARELVAIQNKVSSLPIKAAEHWSWRGVVLELLDRAKERILQNGFFDIEKVERLRREIGSLSQYFEAVQPLPYLDDISTKNLLICQGALSGIVDIDEMGFGDTLSYVALTYMALLNEEYDTDYVEYILAEMKPNAAEKRAFLFYTLVFCVDFMGERGMCFLDKQIAVSPQIVDKLNTIYEMLWNMWKEAHFSNDEP